MKKILFALSLCLSFNAFAQPVLNNTSQIGYVAPIAVASVATGTLVPVATAGANVTWSCVGLVKDAGYPIINYTVSSPAGTPFVADYPSANWHFTDPALAAAVGHTYCALSTDSFVLWGAHIAGSAYEVYDNPELELVFPFAYNQIVNNTYSKTNYTAVGGISSYQTGDVTLTYDGYGTLILPNGTYNNVVRVKKVRTNNLGPTLNTYTWYNSTNGERLLIYEEKAGGAVNVVYNTNVVSSLSQYDQQHGINIHNDLGAGRVSVTSPYNIEQINIYSMTGQLIRTYQNIQSPNFHFDYESAKGIYLVNVVSNGITTTQKVVF